MKHVLFVDDERQILDGLQNLLRKQRGEWSMVFACGGDAGLAQLEKQRFDVVVSDLRMPGMDGGTFLQTVRERWPATARIVLSGQAERELLLKAMPAVHQFLSKPCDADRLRNVIERTCAVQACLSDDALRVIIGGIDTLPAVPAIYRELTAVLNSPDAGIPEVAEVLGQDPAMCVKLLQLVNSAYFGLPTRIGSVQQAVGYLGIELVRGLVLSAHIFSGDSVRPVERFSHQRLQEAALLTARLAKKFVKRPERGREAFTAGLLHDIGKVVLLQGLPERYQAILARAQNSRAPLHEIERAELGVTHSEIGAYLLGIWGLPFEIVEVACHHHAPGRVTQGELDVLAAVHVADALADSTCVPGGDAREILDTEFLARAGFSYDLTTWRALAGQYLPVEAA